jgi:HEAT repeat protein
MIKIDEIMKLDIKSKDKIIKLANEIKNDKNNLSKVIEYFKNGSIAEKGNCIEAIEIVTKEKPEYILSNLDFVIDQLNFNAPRIKWESARVISNVAKIYSDKLNRAVPKLLLNTKDNGTVVRWSAAQALTEIAKYNLKIQQQLIPKLKEIFNKEDNNGVKKIYAKAFKSIENNK